MTAPNQLLTIPQACERLQVGRATLYRLFDARKLKRTKIGRAARVSVAQLERYIAQQTR